MLHILATIRLKINPAEHSPWKLRQALLNGGEGARFCHPAKRAPLPVPTAEGSLYIVPAKAKGGNGKTAAKSGRSAKYDKKTTEGRPDWEEEKSGRPTAMRDRQPPS